MITAFAGRVCRERVVFTARLRYPSHQAGEVAQNYRHGPMFQSLCHMP
jgi:hypothetical protein